ncbi:MAG: hypothetical protein E7022_07715 [Desulfovibrio desulfuricans]|jgi:hypothetical protein|nr:hypothetical protein [Desulfovibrio desulfuricans]
MDSQASLPECHGLIFRCSGGAVCGQPPEWEAAKLCLLVDNACLATRFSKYSLSVNGKNLPLALHTMDGGPCLCADWPASGVGTYRCEVYFDGRPLRRDRIVLSSQKLAGSEPARLIEDLQQHLPYGIALAVRKAGGLAGAGAAPDAGHMWKAEYWVLHRVLYGGSKGGKGLLAVLQNLAEGHHRQFVPLEPWTLRHAARRPSPRGLAQAFTRPGNVGESPSGPLLRYVRDSRVAHNADTYENQFVLQLCGQAAARLRRLCRAAAKEYAPPGLADGAEAMAKNLESARRQAAFLDQVSLLRQPPARLTQVQLRLPAYRRSVQLAQMLRRSLPVLPFLPGDEVPLESLPCLYQHWCTLQAVHCLMAATGAQGFRVLSDNILERREDGFAIAFPSRVPLLELHRNGDGLHIRCWAERAFTAQKADGYTSLSSEMRPDITVEITHPHATPRLLLLDPKYKLSPPGGSTEAAPLKADIDKMHAYRDAIRISGSLLPCVAFAGILYPGPTRRFTHDKVAAFCALPSQAATLHTELNELFSRYLNGRPAAASGPVPQVP